MKLLAFLLILILISVILAIFYYLGYNNAVENKMKMDEAQDNIKKLLEEKLQLMNELAAKIKKSVKKKDYLKGFNSLKSQELSTYELDNELNVYLETMINIKNDHKELNNDEYNDLLDNINAIDQKITANKRFFNKNNNALMKKQKGYTKIVCKIAHINVKTSYEIKEPNKD